MAKRPCARPGCPNLVARGMCDACKPKHGCDVRRSDRPWKKWYDSARFRAARIGFLRANPLCVDPYGLHKDRPEAATDLDHKVPHHGSLVLFWLRSNWQALCHGCHSRKTATEDGGFGRKQS